MTTTWKYTGETSATYSDYLTMSDDGDLCTLVAEPGEVYEIAPAMGTEYTVPAEEEGGEPVVRKLPVPPEGPWEKVKATRQTASKTDEKAE